jgi:hypothetical protein
MLNSLPSSVRVQLRTAAGLHDTDGAWPVVLHFRNQVGSSLTWLADLPAEAFEAGWMAPLADLLTIDAAVEESVLVSSQSPAGAEGIEPAGPADRGDDAGSEGADRVVGSRFATSTLAPPTVVVIHHPDDEYYELLVDGERAGILVYHTIGSQLSITHTVIEQTYRGRGFSWALVARHSTTSVRSP